MAVRGNFRVVTSGFNMLNNITEDARRALTAAVDIIKEDTLRAAKGMAPRKTGKLERSGRTRKQYTESSLSFTVSFTAANKGFDYAVWTHDAHYKLGAISRNKPPASSRFIVGDLTVGRQYVERTNNGETKWSEYLEKVFNEAVIQSMSR